MDEHMIARVRERVKQGATVREAVREEYLAVQAAQERANALSEVEFDTACTERAGYTFVKALGSGASRTVYQVCKQDKCDYALKVVKKDEMELTKTASDGGVSPRLYDTFACGKQRSIKRFAIIMSKMDGTLADLLPRTDQVCALIRAVVELLRKCIYTLHISQGDPTLSNILYKLDPRSREPALRLGDWGEGQVLDRPDRYDDVFYVQIARFAYSYTHDGQGSIDTVQKCLQEYVDWNRVMIGYRVLLTQDKIQSNTSGYALDMLTLEMQQRL